jgi:hypothetical protein
MPWHTHHREQHSDDRAPASVIATFEPATAFGNMVRAEGIRRGADDVRQLTILGDGAPWIWNIAAAKLPEATQIVDLFHAGERLHDLARKIEFMPGDRKTNGSRPVRKTSTTATSWPPPGSSRSRASRKTRSTPP